MHLVGFHYKKRICTSMMICFTFVVIPSNKYIGQDVYAKVAYVVRVLARKFPFGTVDGSDIWRTETQEVKVKRQRSRYNRSLLF